MGARKRVSLPTKSSKKKPHFRPNIGFEIPADLDEMIKREQAITSWRSKSEVIRDRLYQAYRDKPLPPVEQPAMPAHGTA